MSVESNEPIQFGVRIVFHEMPKQRPLSLPADCVRYKIRERPGSPVELYMQRSGGAWEKWFISEEDGRLVPKIPCARNTSRRVFPACCRCAFWHEKDPYKQDREARPCNHAKNTQGFNEMPCDSGAGDGDTGRIWTGPYFGCIHFSFNAERKESL